MTPSLRIFFFGTPYIAVPSLKALAHDKNVEIVGVGVFPDRPVGRKQILTPCAVKVAAQELNLPIYEIASKAELIEITQAVDYDLGIVIAFGMIFPETVLEKPTVNVHFSLLPAYRGASPVQAAILNGDTTSGITWQRMVKALDAGDVLYQVKHSIVDKSTATLWKEMADETAESFPQFIQDYLNETLQKQSQDESKATFCGKFSRSDGEILPTIETAQSIYRKFLAFDPWPGIYLETERGRLKILDCALNNSEEAVPLAAADDTTLYLTTVQLAGKKAQPAVQYFSNQ